MTFQKIPNISPLFNKQRQRGRAAKAPDVTSGGGGFKSHSGCWVELFLGSPIFNSSASLLNSQQVCLLPVGTSSHVMFHLKYLFLLYTHECFTRKYTTCKIHTKLHPRPEWRVFHILTSEVIDYIISPLFQGCLCKQSVKTGRAIDLSI